MNGFSHIKWASWKMTLRGCSTSYRLNVKLRYHIALVHVHVMSPAKSYIRCVTSSREIMDVWTTVTVWVSEGYEFLAPKVSYIINHENNTLYSSGREERKKWKKKKRKERKFTECSHIMEYHCNFLQEQKLSVQQHYHQSLPINSKEEIQTDWLFVLPFLLSLVNNLLIMTNSASSIPASNHTTHFHYIHLTTSLVFHMNAFQRLSHTILHWHPHRSHMPNLS